MEINISQVRLFGKTRKPTVKIFFFATHSMDDGLSVLVCETKKSIFLWFMSICNINIIPSAAAIIYSSMKYPLIEVDLLYNFRHVNEETSTKLGSCQRPTGGHPNTIPRIQ